MTTLSIRDFSPNQRRAAYERQKGICPRCGSEKHYELEEMEADHITPWHLGGKTEAENCQMLCKRHNRENNKLLKFLIRLREVNKKQVGYIRVTPKKRYFPYLETGCMNSGKISPNWVEIRGNAEWIKN